LKWRRVQCGRRQHFWWRNKENKKTKTCHSELEMSCLSELAIRSSLYLSQFLTDKEIKDSLVRVMSDVNTSDSWRLLVLQFSSGETSGEWHLSRLLLLLFLTCLQNRSRQPKKDMRFKVTPEVSGKPSSSPREEDLKRRRGRSWDERHKILLIEQTHRYILRNQEDLTLLVSLSFEYGYLSRMSVWCAFHVTGKKHQINFDVNLCLVWCLSFHTLSSLLFSCMYCIVILYSLILSSSLLFHISGRHLLEGCSSILLLHSCLEIVSRESKWHEIVTL
jgi:hypothetical protein